MTPDEVVKVLEYYLADEQTLEMVEKPDKDGVIKTTIQLEERVGYLKNKIKGLQSAISLIQDYQKLREDFVGLDKFINDWLSKRHGIKYGGVLSKDLAQAIVTFLGCGDNLR
jgi:hypothetical protein